MLICSSILCDEYAVFDPKYRPAIDYFLTNAPGEGADTGMVVADRNESLSVAVILESLSRAYLIFNKSLATSTTRCGSKPNFFWSSLSGAEAPNVFMPIMRPALPT